MKRNLLSILVTLVSLMGAQLAVNAQDLTLSDVQNSGCQRGTRSRANENETVRTIVLTKEGTILTVQILGFVSNCATEGFDITPSMSGGSDGEPISVSLDVDPIVPGVAAICICPFNVSFTLHGLESNNFYFSCWWYDGQVSLTEGEPLTLESITEPVYIDGWYYFLDKVNHTAIVRGNDVMTDDLVIPWVLSYEGQEYYVTGIDEIAFINYKALKSVTLPTNLTRIGDYAFAGCDNLTDVYCFAENVPTTGSDVFKETPIASATLHVPAGLVDKYEATAPWNEFGNIVGEGEVTIDGLNYYLNSSFYTAPLTKGNNWEGELDIPSEVSFYGQTYTVTSLARAAFYDNSKLTRVRIPKTLESILRGYYTTNPYEDVPTELVSSDHMNPFRGCTALESIEVEEENQGLKSVDGVLFSQDGKGYYYYQTNSYYGTGLYCYPAGARRESYTIPNGVEWIGSGAFEDNQYISTLTIPSSMKMMYYSVFAGCSNLKDIYCNAENVPVAFSFEDFPISSATLHVPAGSVEKYKATSPWNKFGNIVAIEESHQPLPFLEGNPIWVYKYEHIPTPRDPEMWMRCWVDTGNRSFTYFFLGRQQEIDGKVYTMIGEITSRGEDMITFDHWYPVREENGIVYTITDSLPEFHEFEYNEDYEIPYLQQGNECVLYNFGAEIGDKLDKNNTVKSFDSYQLMDGTECRVLKTGTHYDLYEKLGYRDDDGTYGLIDPLFGIIIATNGHAYVKRLNAFYQDGMMLYKAPDAQEGLCVNDTIWSFDDAYSYARSYKADPCQEKVFSYIRQLQTATPVIFTQNQMATIILPTAPDASKGKYYGLDRREDGKIIFEQEKQPQAHIPYIIIPNEDFSIDIGTLDLAGLSPDTVSIGSIDFIGSYSREEPVCREGWYIDIFDTTPDCGFAPLGETGKGAFIGALRAYLTVNWDDPINHEGTKGPGEKMDVVLHDYGTNIASPLGETGEGARAAIYDLSGRKVNSQLKRGIYIQGNKKIAVK